MYVLELSIPGLIFITGLLAVNLAVTSPSPLLFIAGLLAMNLAVPSPSPLLFIAGLLVVNECWLSLLPSYSSLRC